MSPRLRVSRLPLQKNIRSMSCSNLHRSTHSRLLALHGVQVPLQRVVRLTLPSKFKVDLSHLLKVATRCRTRVNIEALRFGLLAPWKPSRRFPWARGEWGSEPRPTETWRGTSLGPLERTTIHSCWHHLEFDRANIQCIHVLTSVDEETLLQLVSVTFENVVGVGRYLSRYTTTYMYTYSNCNKRKNWMIFHNINTENKWLVFTLHKTHRACLVRLTDPRAHRGCRPTTHIK